jgi:hypothetical protein
VSAAEALPAPRAAGVLLRLRPDGTVQMEASALRPQLCWLTCAAATDEWYASWKLAREELKGAMTALGA